MHAQRYPRYTYEDRHRELKAPIDERRGLRFPEKSFIPSAVPTSLRKVRRRLINVPREAVGRWTRTTELMASAPLVGEEIAEKPAACFSSRLKTLVNVAHSFAIYRARTLRKGCKYPLPPRTRS